MYYYMPRKSACWAPIVAVIILIWDFSIFKHRWWVWWRRVMCTLGPGTACCRRTVILSNTQGKAPTMKKRKKADVKNNNKKETNKESDYTTPLEERISYEDDMQLAGLLYFLQKSILEFHQFGNQFLGLHGSFYGMGLQAATDVVHARLEGPDVTHLAREVALKSVIKNVGTTHWGWWLSNMFEMIPSLDRFFKNPWYSPRIAELGRHLIFFSHKHYSTKKRLRYSREIERRRGGPEHQWYDWHMFRYDEVVHCGEAFMEMQFLTNMMSEMEVCSDPRARKLLRDIGWVFALTRQSESLPFLLLRKMMTPNKGVILQSHLDNIITVLAPQCVPLVTAMSVPLTWGAPADLEGYWSIPGTNINIQRGEALTTVEYGKTKQEQENIKEEEEEFDLFHGLADQPSYERKQKQK
ncbi:hypothetical protein AGDE_16715 [Angomonas deanei]|uniref:Acyl-CoA oxidase, putative n=1 Tax=Angomonas deanei TaxID=59799 RepID=A0A7G2CTI5_9TRYP|nr:hypothetical protein AGDE_16715 [Angomonas deanei]CAD2221532.1 Acyl-CoA oxidase, putative [Angomonas deanei]|eukprot:EPY16559.1 hypothetical protein AGDE_16715 [Angomonas deanei]